MQLCTPGPFERAGTPIPSPGFATPGPTTSNPPDVPAPSSAPSQDVVEAAKAIAGLLRLAAAAAAPLPQEPEPDIRRNRGSWYRDCLDYTRGNG